MAIPGTVPVTGPVAPTSLLDEYPSHIADYGKGGYVSVALFTDLDLIPSLRRTEGMMVRVNATSLYYVLAADLVTWDIFSSLVVPVGPDLYQIGVSVTGEIPQLTITKIGG